MQTIFNCCNAFEAHAGKWICSTQQLSESGAAIDEEIIGEESPACRPLVQDDPNNTKCPSTSGRGQLRSRSAPPPIGREGSGEEEKDSQKARLQKLIRDFAHDAVGPGLEIEAQSLAICGSSAATGDGRLQALLRMDRRLSRLELWPPSCPEEVHIKGSTATIAVPLQQVAQITKTVAHDEGDVENTERDNLTLTVIQRSAPDLRLIFPSVAERDRAHTCLRIFRMSVDQSLDSQSNRAESDIHSYNDSTVGSH